MGVVNMFTCDTPNSAEIQLPGVGQFWGMQVQAVGQVGSGYSPFSDGN